MKIGKIKLNFKEKFELLIIVIFTILAITIGVCLKIFKPDELDFSSSNFSIYYSDDNENVISMISNYKPENLVNSGESAISSLKSLSDYYEFKDLENEIRYNTTLVNAFGKVHKTSQIYNGIEVYGRGLNIFENNGTLDIYGNYLSNINIDTTPQKSSDEIIQSFKLLEDWKDYIVVAKPELTIFSLYNIDPTLCYVFTATNGKDSFEILLNANTGELVKSFTNNYGISSPTVTVTDSNGDSHSVQVDYNNGTYYLRDSLRNIYVRDYSVNNLGGYFYAYLDYLNNYNISSTNYNNFSSKTINAYTTIVDAYDYYANEENIGISLKGLNNSHDEFKNYETSNKDAYNASGSAVEECYIEILVNYYETEGEDYNNAAYTKLSYDWYNLVLIGTAKNYIDCDDVLAHEYQHGVTQWNAGNGRGNGLIYEGQSGALNEAYSDIFASLIEGYSLENPDFWSIGEDLTSGSIRDMSNPDQTEYEHFYGLTRTQPNHYNKMLVCNVADHNITGSGTEHDAYCDYNFVHMNNSIITHSYYQMYSAYKTLKGDSYDETEFKQKIGTLLFGVLQTLTENADFQTWALSTQENALDFALEEKDINFYYAVKEGLEAVGLDQSIDESILDYYQITFNYDSTSESILSGSTIGYTNNKSSSLFNSNNPDTHTLITIPTASKEYYKFLGWYTSNTSSGKPVYTYNSSNELVLVSGSTYVTTDESGDLIWNLSADINLYARFKEITNQIFLVGTINYGEGVKDFTSSVEVFSDMWLEDEDGNKVNEYGYFKSGTKLYLKYTLNNDDELNKWLTFSFGSYSSATNNIYSDAGGSYIIMGSDTAMVIITGNVNLKKFSFTFEDNAKFSNLSAVLTTNSQVLNEGTDYPSKYKIELKYEYIENSFYDLDGVTWSIVSGNATISENKYIEYALGEIIIKITPTETKKLYTINLIELDENGNGVTTSQLSKLYISSIANDETKKYGDGLTYSQWNLGETIYFNYEYKVGYTTTTSGFYYINKQTSSNVVIQKENNSYSLTLPILESDENFKNFFGDVQENRVLNVYIKVSSKLKDHNISISLSWKTGYSGDLGILNKDIYFKIKGSNEKLESGDLATFKDIIEIYCDIDSTDQYNYFVSGLQESGSDVGSFKSTYYEYEINYNVEKEENIDLVILVSYETRKYDITLDYESSDFAIEPYLTDDSNNVITKQNDKYCLEYNSTIKYYIKYTLTDSDSTLYEIDSIKDKNNISLSFNNGYYFNVINDSVTIITIKTKQSIKEYDLDINLNLLKAEGSVTDFNVKVYYSTLDSETNTQISDDLKLDYAQVVQIFIEIPISSLEFFYEISSISINENKSIYESFSYEDLKTLDNIAKDKEKNTILIKITREENYTISIKNIFDIDITQNYQIYNIKHENSDENYIKSNYIYKKINNVLIESDTFNYGEIVYLDYELIQNTEQYKYIFKRYNIVKLDKRIEITETLVIEDKEYYKFELSQDLLTNYKDDNNIITIETESYRQLQTYSINISINKEFEELNESYRTDYIVSSYYTLSSDTDNKLTSELEYGTKYKVFIEIPLNTLYYRYSFESILLNNISVVDITENYILEKNKEALENSRNSIAYSFEKSVSSSNSIEITVKQYYQNYNVYVYNEENDITTNVLKTIPLQMSYDVKQSGGVNLTESELFKNTTYNKYGYSFSDFKVELNNSEYCPNNYVEGIYNSELYLPGINQINWSVNIYPNWVANRYKIVFDYLTNNGDINNKELSEVYFEFDSSNIFAKKTDTEILEKLPVAIKDNYQFLGWYISDTDFVTNINQNGCDFKNNIIINNVTYIDVMGNWLYASDITLIAKFGGLSKEIVLNNEGENTSIFIEYGTGIDSGIFSDEGRTKNYIYQRPSKTNYTFDGWFMVVDNENIQIFTNDDDLKFAGDLDSYISDGKWIYSSSITLFAKYTPNLIEINFVLNGGSLIDEFSELLESKTLMLKMDSSNVYYRDSEDIINFADFFNYGLVTKVGYSFTGWCIDELCNNILFNVLDYKLQWNIISNYTTEVNDEILFSPSEKINSITLYAGFNTNRYEIKFKTSDSSENLEGNSNLYFEYGTSNIYNAEIGGDLVSLEDITYSTKTGYRIVKWNIVKLGLQEIQTEQVLFSFEYVDFYTNKNATINLNKNLQINNKNVFNNENWIISSNLVLEPEYEAIAIELKLSKSSDVWHSGLSTQMSYYAKYNDNNIYISDNNKLIQIKPEESITTIDNINSNYIELAKFVGWGFKSGQTGIFNNLLLIKNSSDEKSFEKNIQLYGINYTDEKGNFIYFKQSSLTLIAIAERVTKSIEFKVGDDFGNFLNSNNEITEDTLSIVLNLYHNGTKDHLTDSDGEIAKFPKAFKVGHTFIGWALENTNVQLIEFVDDELDFVPEVSIIQQSVELNLTNENRYWIGTENITLVPLFNVNVYSITFIASNQFENASIPNLEGLIYNNSIEEYDGKNATLYFEYNSYVLYDSIDIATRKIVNVPIAESEGFKFTGWILNNGNSLFNEKCEVVKNLSNYIENGKFIATNDIELFSDFKLIYYEVEFYASSDNSIGKYYMNYTSDKLYEKINDDYQEIRMIEPPEEIRVIKTEACNYVFENWAVAKFDDNGEFIILNSDLAIIDNTSETLSYKISRNLVVVPNYKVVQNTYGVRFYVNNLNNIYNVSNISNYGFSIQVINHNNLEEVEYGRQIQFSLEILTSHNKSTPLINVNNDKQLISTNGIYSYTVQTENNIIISGIEINKYIVTFKLPNGEQVEYEVLHGESSPKPKVEKEKMEIIWFKGSFNNVTGDKVVVVRKLNMLIPISIVVAIILIIIIVSIIKKHKEKIELNKSKEKMSTVIHSQMPNKDNTYQNNSNMQNGLGNNINSNYVNNNSNNNYQSSNYSNNFTLNGFNNYNNNMFNQHLNSNNLPKRDFSDIENQSQQNPPTDNN